MVFEGLGDDEQGMGMDIDGDDDTLRAWAVLLEWSWVSATTIPRNIRYISHWEEREPINLQHHILLRICVALHNVKRLSSGRLAENSEFVTKRRYLGAKTSP